MQEVLDLFLPVLVIVVILLITEGLFSAFALILGWIAVGRPRWM